MGLTYLNAAMIEQPASIRQLSAFDLQAFNVQTSNLTANNFSIGTITSNPVITGNTIVGGSLTAVQGIFDQNGNSFQWNTTYATVCSLSSSWDDSNKIVPTVTNYLSTQNVLISTIQVDSGNTSSQWNDTYTVVAVNSASWEESADILPTIINYLSATPNVLISSIQTNTGNTSDQWNSTYATVSALSGIWQESFSTVTNYLSTIPNVLISSIQTGSGNTSDQWNETYTVVATNSALWEESAEIIPTVANYLSTQNILVSTVDVAGHILSGGNDLSDVFIHASLYPGISTKLVETDLKVIGLSSVYQSTVTLTQTNSGSWNVASTAVNANRDLWDSAYTVTRQNSSVWLDNITVIPAISNYLPSSRYEAPITVVTTYSAEWIANNNLTSLNSYSWDSVYTTVNETSASTVTLSTFDILAVQSIINYLTGSVAQISAAEFDGLSGNHIFAGNITTDNLTVQNLHVTGGIVTLGLTSQSIVDNLSASHFTANSIVVNDLIFTGLTSLSTIEKLTVNDLVVTSLTSLSTTIGTFQVVNVITSADVLSAQTLISPFIETSSIVTPADGNSYSWGQAATFTANASLSTALWNEGYNTATQTALSTDQWNFAYTESSAVSLSTAWWNLAYESISANAANWNTTYELICGNSVVNWALSSSLDYISNNLFYTNKLSVSTDSADPAIYITQIGSGKAIIIEDDTRPDSTPLVVDSQGSVAIGYTESLATQSYTDNSVIPKLQVLGTTTDSSSIGLYSFSTTNDRSSTVIFTRSAANSPGNTSQVADGMSLGGISWAGDDGFNKVAAASIMATVHGVPGALNMPTRLTFSTTPSGNSVPVERVRITPNGYVGIGTTEPNHVLTVAGNISATGIFATDSGTSLNWNDTYTVVAVNSASWEESADILPTVNNYLSTENVLVSSLHVSNNLTVVGDISAAGTVYFNNTLTTSVCAMSGDGITPFVMQFTNGLLTAITY